MKSFLTIFSVIAFAFQAYSAPTFSHVVNSRGDGGTKITSRPYLVSSGFSSPSLFANLSSSPPNTFGGFSYDPNSGLASYLSNRGDGGTSVITQAFEPGVGFSGPIFEDSLSSSAPSTFGGFSYSSTTMLASLLTNRAGGGTEIVTQTFEPGIGFSGVVLKDSFSSSSPDTFGGFSYDPLTGLASVVTNRGDGGASVFNRAYTPGLGFSGVGISDSFSENSPNTFGGFSFLSAIPEPSAGTLLGACLACFFFRRQTAARNI